MAYVTLTMLAELPGALELAQVASDKHGVIPDADLMDATLRGLPRTVWQPDEVEAADKALARIEQAIREAGEVIDGYIGRRYALPLSKVPGILGTWARAIARYRLHGERISGEPTDPVVRDYRDALRFLQQIAEGKFSLGADDPSSQGAGPGDVQILPGHKVFGRAFLP